MSATPTEHPAYPSEVYAWFVVGLLVLTSMVSYIDRQIVALLVEPIKADLGISDTQIGWLYAGFALFFAVAGLPLASLADRVNRRRLICFGVAFWSLMTVACGLARSFGPLLAARIGVGVGEATLTPSAHSLIGDYFPRSKIPLAIGVFALSGTLGTGIAFMAGGTAVDIVSQLPPITFPLIGTLKSWQIAFMVVGAPGLLVLLLFLAVKEPVRRRKAIPVASKEFPFAALAAFYRRNWRTMVTHHAGFGAVALAGYAVVFWTPTFFMRIHGLSAGEVGLKLGFVYFVFGTLGTYAGAWVGQRLYRKGHFDWPFRGTLTYGWIMIPLTALAALTDSATLAWLVYGPLVFFINLPFGMAFGSLPVIAPNRLRAQVVAVYLIVGSAVGMGLGPVVLGAVSDNLFPQADGIRYSIVFVMAACAPIWIALLWFGRSDFAQTLKEAESLDRDDPDNQLSTHTAVEA